MEKCIFFKNGVYVIVPMNAKEACQNDSFICANNYNYVANDGCLYGGRVRISYEKASYYTTSGMHLFVDGIKIVSTTIGETANLNRDMDSIMCHLNSIEANGVDAFLANYKESIQTAYEELKELRDLQLRLIDDTADDENKKKDHLTKLETIISTMTLLLWVIFSLSIRMPAALDNEKMSATYESVIESIS